MFVTFVGESGSGKSTVVSALRKTLLNCQILRSCTTRPRRADETKDNILTLTIGEFNQRIDAGHFSWITYVYETWYGTLRHDLNRVRDEPGMVFLQNVTPDTLPVARSFCVRNNIQLISVNIVSPSTEERRGRLSRRKCLDFEQLLRMKPLPDSLSPDSYDVTVNGFGPLDNAVNDIKNAIAELT